MQQWSIRKNFQYIICQAHDRGMTTRIKDVEGAVPRGAAQWSAKAVGYPDAIRVKSAAAKGSKPASVICRIWGL